MARGRMAPAAALVALLVAGGGAARAEHDHGYGEHPTVDRSPERGPHGTVVKLWGTGCIYRGTPWERARVSFYEQPSGPGTYRIWSPYFRVNEDGSWEGKLVVPDEAPLGHYVLDAGCYASDMRLQAGEQPFTVADVAPPTTTTTTTTAPRPSPTTTASTTTTAAKRPSGTTTTTSSTTTTTEAVPPPTAPPDDDHRRTAAPAAADRPGSGGGPASALALLAVLPVGVGGAMAVRRLRRR